MSENDNNQTGYSIEDISRLKNTKEFVENGDLVRFVYETEDYEDGNYRHNTTYCTVNGHLSRFNKTTYLGHRIETFYDVLVPCTQNRLLEDILLSEPNEARNLVEEIMSGGKNIREYCEKLLDEYLTC